MWKWGMLFVLVWGLVLGVGVGGQDEEKAIRELYDGLQAELQAQDTSLLSLYYAAEFRNLQREDLNRFQQRLEETLLGYEELTVTLEVQEVQVVEEQARAQVLRTLKGLDAKTRKPREETCVLADDLVLQADGWRILTSGEIDLAAQQRLVKGRQIADPTQGFALTVPDPWRLYVYQSPLPRLIEALSPRLTGRVILGLVDLPTPMTAEQALKTDEKVAGMVQSDRKLLREGELQVAGQPAYESVSTFTLGTENIQTRRVYVVYEGTVYFLICQSSPEEYETYTAEFQRIIDHFHLRPKQRPSASVAGGSIEGQTYRNETYGVEISAPEGWAIEMNQSQYLAQVSMNSPAGDGFGLFLIIDLPVEATAEMAVRSDEKVAQNVSTHYEEVSQGEVEISGLEGYECVSVFEVEGLPRRQRIRTYLVVGKRLYGIVADALPPERFGDLESTLRGIIGSFKLAEPE